MEKIIYSDLLNQTELLRLFAKNDMPTLGVRVMSIFDLCRYGMNKLGINMDGTYINDNESGYIYNMINDFATFQDGINMKNSINTFRDTGKGNDVDSLKQYLNPLYEEKLKATISAFNKYNEYKKEHHLYDTYDMLYRLKDNDRKSDIEVVYYSDLPYSSFIISVLEKLFTVKEESYLSLFKKEKQHIEVKKCLGINNEINNALNIINEKHLPIDECLFVLPNNSYMPLLNSYLNYQDIPYTSSIGFPYAHTNVGKFIKRLTEMSNNFYGYDAYKALFNEPFFAKDKYVSNFNGKDRLEDEFIKSLGWLRLSFDHLVDIDSSLYKKEIYESLVSFKQSLGKGFYEFIKENVVDDGYNYEALTLLEKNISLCQKYDIPIDDIIDSIYLSSISSHISSPARLHIASFKQAFSSLRKHIFIFGLDASFPGSPKEDYLIYDEEYLLMDKKEYTSASLVKMKEKMMNILLSVGENIYLSYPYFDNVELKKKNPSSIISNQYDVDSIKEFAYTDDNLSINQQLIDKYNEGYILEVDNNHQKIIYDGDYLLTKSYSPSSFGTFFDNPLLFVLSNIFGLSTSEKEDPYVVIAPNDRGTLFHHIVERFDKNKISKNDLLIKGEKEFSAFIKKKPPIVNSELSKEHDNFIDTLSKFYDADVSNHHVYSEKPLTSLINGVKFHGTFDRLEKDALGNYILVDYKTGRKVEHIDEDVTSCMQGIIYMVMIENELGIKVDHGEFRYPFVGNKVIRISYNQENKNILFNKIEEFKSILKSGLPLGEEEKYVDKYKHLISLFKEVKSDD